MSHKSFIILALFLSAALCYNNYKQCDAAWGSHHLGTSSNTICKAGCLMSSVSDVISGHNPGTLNTWLTNHHGYANGDLFVWTAVAPFGLSYKGQITNHDEMRSLFHSGHIVILNVHNGGHWVLTTGVEGTNFAVHDPGFSNTHYTQADVVRAGIYAKGKNYVEPKKEEEQPAEVPVPEFMN